MEHRSCAACSSALARFENFKFGFFFVADPANSIAVAQRESEASRRIGGVVVGNVGEDNADAGAAALV